MTLMIDVPEELAQRVDRIPDRDRFISQALTAALKDRERRQIHDEEILQFVDECVEEARAVDVRSLNRDEEFATFMKARDALTTVRD